MKHKSRRMLSLLLALTMCLGLMSPYAWAAEVEEVEPEESFSEVEAEEAAEAEAVTPEEASVEENSEPSETDVSAKEDVATADEEDTVEEETPAAAGITSEEDYSTDTQGIPEADKYTKVLIERSASINDDADPENAIEEDESETELPEETVEESVSEEPMMATVNDLNQSSVFVKQQTNYTCTLASAVMLVRRAAIGSGNANWGSITESAMRPTAWLEGSGLYFCYCSAPLSQNCSIKLT